MTEISMHAVAPNRAAKIMRIIEEASPVQIAIALYALSSIILLGFGFIIHFRTDPNMLEADESEYFTLSTEIMTGYWAISPRRTLAYPMMMAAIRAVADNIIIVQTVFILVFSLSVPALFVLVRRLTGSNIPATVAAFLFSIWPSAIFYGSSLYSETAALPVFLMSLCLLPVGSRVFGEYSPRFLATAASGLVLGLAAHIRPMYLLFLPVLAIIVILEEKSFSVALKRVAVAWACFFLIVFPWSVYISARYDRVIVLTANGGETLAGGLTPKLLEPIGRYKINTGGRTAWVGPGKWLPLYENGYLSEDELRAPYASIDTVLQKRVIFWAKEHPIQALWLEFRKLTYMWGIYPIMENGLWQALFGNLPTVALLANSLWSLARDRETRTRFARLWMLAFFVSGVALISWGSWRFRQPADAGLIAFVVCALWRRYTARFMQVVAT